jgi:short subunit dehydrogenase-like uncharacterized protein
MTEPRDLDLVLYGATGFVGRLTAQYLATNGGAARIGIAGRSQSKLDALRDELGVDWPVIVADSADGPALDALAARTKAVITTVGPYRKYGMELARACAEAGTHYGDLNGEVLFMRAVIDAYDGAARDSGARIVHSCGFDSIPSDLGVLALHEAVQAAGAGELEDTTLVVESMRGGLSGGTFASLKGQLDEVRADTAQRKIALDPYALSPDRSAEPDLGQERDFMGVERDEEIGLWLAPFVMGSINVRSVRRSNALQDWAYGRKFRYRETMSTGSGLTGPVKGAAVAGGLGAFMAGLSFGPTRKLLDAVLPDPGEGPSEESRRKGSYRIAIHGRTSSGRRFVSRVAQKGDPGYEATAVMFGESGLCLALDDGALPQRAGVLTPATGMGDALISRLRAAGLTLEAAPA